MRTEKEGKHAVARSITSPISPPPRLHDWINMVLRSRLHFLLRNRVTASPAISDLEATGKTKLHHRT